MRCAGEPSAGDNSGKKLRAIKGGAGLDGAVRQKHGLNLRYRRACDSRDEFFIRKIAHEVWIYNVLRTHVSDAAIHHRELAMIPQIEARGIVTEKSHGQHRHDLDAALLQ